MIGLAVLPLLVFVAKTGAGPIRWIPRPGVRDVLEFYEHLAGGNNWGLLLIYVRRLRCCGDAARETSVRTRQSREQLGDLAGAVPSDLADSFPSC